MSRKERGGQARKTVDIVITTLGDQRLLGSLSKVIEKTLSVANGKVYLLTEEDASKKVTEYARSAGLVVLLVPKEWDSGRAKGRAIWWFAQEVADENRWYMFLDDDSYPLDDRFQCDVARYEEEGKLLGNCILVPRRGKSLLPHLCDNLRYADDRFSLGLALNHLMGKPVFGMHGEGMLVRGDILKRYWKGITSIVEDAEFGIRAGEGTKFFRSSTEISILSPHSIGDFWKQRRRWYLGLMSILPKYPLASRVLVSVRMLTWSLGFLGIIAWIFIPILLITGGLSSSIVAIDLTIVSCFLLSLVFFIVGARRTKTMPQAVVLFPIYSTIGALLPLYVLLTLNRGRGFDVIDK
ncbi:MAG: glycosyltransferase family 2 protein [Dehalococcoidia bacterium]|nr:glycosyltransferase family 2 protein [Dehalococcoidia bacterium]